jgi:uncharacterized protein (TIGR02246 family)
MLGVWEDSDEILCLLPMMLVHRGRTSIRQAWEPLFSGEIQLDMEIKHLAWIESDSLAIHLIEEHVKAQGSADKQVVYATNVYRKGSAGWRLLMHQNSPTPPPPGLRMPDRG